MANKYVVAPGWAFTAGGHIYKPGDSIPESAFPDKVYFSKLLSQKCVIKVLTTPGTKAKGQKKEKDEAVVVVPEKKEAQAGASEQEGTKESIGTSEAGGQ